MDKWTASEFLAFWGIVVGSAIALVAIGFSIWAARKWGTRRGKLLLAYTVTDLMPAGGPRDGFGFTYRDIPVEDPQLVTLRLRNIGPHDITRDLFDQGEALQISLNATFMGLLRATSTAGATPRLAMRAIGTENAEIGFKPGLLPRKAEWTAEFLVEGKASPEVRGCLINTDIDQGESNSMKVLREVARLTAPWPFKPLMELLLP